MYTLNKGCVFRKKMAQNSTSGTSSRRQHPRDHDTASITSSRIADSSEWEANEVKLLQLFDNTIRKLTYF